MNEPDETTVFEEIAIRRGKKQARDIAKIADRAPLHMDTRRAWLWAEMKYNARLKERR